MDELSEDLWAPASRAVDERVFSFSGCLRAAIRRNFFIGQCLLGLSKAKGKGYLTSWLPVPVVCLTLARRAARVAEATRRNCRAAPQSYQNTTVRQSKGHREAPGAKFRPLEAHFVAIFPIIDNYPPAEMLK